MTGTSASPVTVREARPEEGPAVAALLRESYVAFAAELPPDLLRGWIDDVLDPGGATTLVALAEGTLAGTARLHLADTYPIPLPAGSVGVRAWATAATRRRTSTSARTSGSHHPGVRSSGLPWLCHHPYCLAPPPRSHTRRHLSGAGGPGESLLRGRTRGGKFGNC
jgi:hypothetical protein